MSTGVRTVSGSDADQDADRVEQRRFSIVRMIRSLPLAVLTRLLVASIRSAPTSHLSFAAMAPKTAAMVTAAPIPTMIRMFLATECPRLSSTDFTSA